LQEQQEAMADLADCILAIFALESGLLRARKLGQARGMATGQSGEQAGSRNSAGAAEVAAAMTAAFAEEALGTVEQAARRVLAGCAEGDALAVQLAVLRRFARVPAVDVIAANRSIARWFLDRGRYKM
jgi:butyryl-CoA dehydrogenase